MSTTDETRGELSRLADDLDRRALAASDVMGGYVEALPIVRRATILLIRAACAGLLGDPKGIVERTAVTEGTRRECSPIDQFAGTLLYIGRSAECDETPTREQLRTCRDLTPAALG